jgi:4a-hydroxytetrahydrobiopterin dehydratase
MATARPARSAPHAGNHPAGAHNMAHRAKRAGSLRSSPEPNMRKKLGPAQIDDQLVRIPHWRLDPRGAAIAREFMFADFAQAFSFMTQLALAAEKLDHHPEWANIYNRVNVKLTTHDAGGLTGQDFKLAACADEAFGRFALVPGAP